LLALEHSFSWVLTSQCRGLAHPCKRHETAGKAREAVDMYTHLRDWEAALRVAQEHDPESVPDVLVAQVCAALRAQALFGLLLAAETA
jgi:hypothetical protein